MGGSGDAVSVEEIRKHSTPEDCWIVVDDGVWDLTAFAPEHPGGDGIIYKYAGRDATVPYSEIHAPSVLKDNLDASKYIGKLDRSTVDEEWVKPLEEDKPVANKGEKPPLQAIINTYDFEDVAHNTLPEKTWAFYSSGATDCFTREANSSLFNRVWWRPRILRNVKNIDTSSKILGIPVSMPLFISPAAMAKMIHPDGELAMARGCAQSKIVQMVSTNASYSISEILDETPEDHGTIFQLYINKDRQKTRDMIKHLLSLRPRIRGITITVDTAVPGKREADERLKADETLRSSNSGQGAGNDNRGGGLGRIMGSFIDDALCWDDLLWIREMVGPDMPLVLKGIQTANDAVLAMEAGMQGIMVSNHGARNLDTSPPVLVILLELHKCCPQIFDRMEVYVDGGIRRGTDILKCLCLGATAVGIGRHFLYSLTYGQEGVEHLIEILKDELETSMKLIGITDLSQVDPALVNTGDIDHMVPSSLRGHPYAFWRPKAHL